METVTLYTRQNDKTLAQLDIRARFHLTIIAVRRGQEFIISPGGHTELKEGDTLLVLGAVGDIERMETL